MARALIVDDSTVGRMILSRFVRREGWCVDEAEGGESGLAALERDPPDIVFLDLLMPGMSGIDVLRHIRSGGIDVPVVVVTAEVQSHHRQACERLGVHAYLNKPIVADQIRRVLESTKAVLL